MTTADGNRREELLGRVREVFAGHEAELGTPKEPTKDGFLALAREGKDVWNAWRAEWPDRGADFSRLDFRETPIDFSDFVFGHSARFTEATFGDTVSFVGAIFRDATSFKRVQFTGEAIFDGATFGDGASFAGATFGYNASFKCARFGDAAYFVGALFRDVVRIEGAWFGSMATFAGAQFGYKAIFDGATFGDGASFEGAQFGETASFIGAQFSNRASFEARTQKWVERMLRTSCRDEAAVQERIQLAAERDLRSDAFQCILFTGAHFDGDVSFQNRVYLGTTKFDLLTKPFYVAGLYGRSEEIEAGPARFRRVPDFHGCTLHQDTSFEGAEFLAPATPDAARAYRTLKLAMSKEQATREEQRFFKLEMETERELAHGGRWWLFTLYKVFSDYGFGLKQPICRVWVLIGGICALLQLPLVLWHVVASSQHQPLESFAQRFTTWLQYSLISFSPLPGFDRVQTPLRTLLFGNDGIQLVAIVIEILHKQSALLALFLVALALRNLFKMKG